MGHGASSRAVSLRSVCRQLIVAGALVACAPAGANGYWQLQGASSETGSWSNVPNPTSYEYSWEGFQQRVKSIRDGGRTIVFRHSWTEPPSTLVPDRILEMRFRAEVTSDSIANRNIASSMGADLNPGSSPPLGYGGVIDLLRNVPSPSVNHTKTVDEQSGRARVPDGKGGDKLYLRISAGEGQVQAKKQAIYTYVFVVGQPAGGSAASAPAATSAVNSSIAREITGVWTSDYGQVRFTGSNASLGGTWDQQQGRGQITGGQYDPRTKRLFFYYTQSWNQMNGRADFTLTESGSEATLAGNWKQWPIGKTEADVARTGTWTMSRK